MTTRLSSTTTDSEPSLKLVREDLSSTSTPIKIASFNINGIRNALKKDILYPFIDSTNADVICLQEVRVQSNQVGEFNTALKSRGYQHIKWNCAKKAGSYGVVTISKLPFISTSTDFPDGDDEGRFAVTEFETFVLVNLYVVNSGRKLVRLDYRIQWDEKLRNYLKTIQKPLVVTGDLNVSHQAIDIANHKANYNKSAGYTQREIDSFSTILEEVNLIDVFRHLYPDRVQYTYFSNFNQSRARNIGWRLDYFLISKGLIDNVIDCIVDQDQPGSDHVPVFLSINI
ncbi:hypothetical protein RCL1_007079 [Eukaryota sp. TZLM3-RCL]